VALHTTHPVLHLIYTATYENNNLRTAASRQKNSAAGNNAEACRYWRMADKLEAPEAKELLKICENW
jgi:hypothetical protein